MIYKLANSFVVSSSILHFRLIRVKKVMYVGYYVGIHCWIMFYSSERRTIFFKLIVYSFKTIAAYSYVSRPSTIIDFQLKVHYITKYIR